MMDVTEILAELHPVSVRHDVSEDVAFLTNAEFSQWKDYTRNLLVTELREWLLAREHREEACRVPATWWQQFKSEYFSGAMLRMWPIRYRVHGYRKILHMCPHATERWDHKKMRHVRFLLHGMENEEA
jgi:hypothetical protein